MNKINLVGWVKGKNSHKKAGRKDNRIGADQEDRLKFEPFILVNFLSLPIFLSSQ